MNFKKLILLALLVVISGAYVKSAHADATIQVNSTADTIVVDGQCTLREAAANADLVAGGDITGGDCGSGSATGVDTITFSAPVTVTLTGDLIIHSAVYLDGITGGNGVCATKQLGIIISGAHYIDLGTESSGSTIRGLDIQGGGIRLQESSGTKIQCNMIGLDATGLTAVGGLGISILNGSNHIIGGSLEGDGNVVSGNNSNISGISFNGGDGFVVKGNIIGLDKDGDVAMLTQSGGMNITGNVTNLTIGGPGTFERNIISGNYGGTFAHGILFLNGVMSNITIQNNYIGTDMTGMFARPNKDSGIDFCDATGCPGSTFSITHLTIGGANANEGNIFSGNVRAGISLKAADDYVIKGNYFGLDALGTGLIPNIGDSIELERDYNGVIGGATAAERNYFAGNGDGGSEGRGLHILDYLGTSLSVMGNYFGVNRLGGIIGGYFESAVSISGMDLSGVVFGGTGAGEGNIIAGGQTEGISISGPNVRVFGNKIGTNTSGLVEAGYGNEIGVMISSSGVGHQYVSSDVKIGGVNPGEANIIAGNNVAGVVVMLTSDEIGLLSIVRNSVLGNSIFHNNNNGIDHLIFDEIHAPPFGSTANDSGDADTGPNDYLNHPVINTVDTGTGEIAYTLDVPAGTYRVEFFKNPTSGTYGEGEIYIGYDTFISTGSSKQQIKTLSLTSGDFITANVTEDLGAGTYGSTSEFSQAYEPIIPSSSGGGNSSGRRLPVDMPVAVTVPSPEGTCPVFTGYYRKGNKNSEIKNIQSFLNKELGINLPLTGYFGLKTEQAVRKFQVKYSDDILTPWHPPFAIKSTGRWYKTTLMKANQLKGCANSEIVLEDNGVHWKLPSLRLQ